MALTRRRLLQVAAGSIALPSVRALARTETYPSQPVRILVGFPAGGPVDIAARVISPWLTEKLGQAFAIENQPGESGNVATRMALKAPPNGYTLLLCGPVNTINTTLFSGLDFDFARDCAPVASLYRVPLVVEVRPSIAITSVVEFLTYAKANPGKLKIAYAGNGTPQHVGIELFKSMAGVDLKLVPYLGSAPALADLLKGEVDGMFDPLPSSIAHIKRGDLRPLAVTTSVRSAALPYVPAMSDFVPGYEAGSWFGIVAPKGTPVDIIKKLNDGVNAGLADPTIKPRITELGGMVISGSPAAFATFIAKETEGYRRVIQAANIRAK